MGVQWINSARFATSTFDPLSLSPALWLDADDASTFSYSSGVVVSQWNDKSGNARHVSPTGAGPSRNATYGSRTAVYFPGTDSGQGCRTASATSIAAPFFIFVVAAIQGATRTKARLVCHRTTGNFQTLIGENTCNGSSYAGTAFATQGSVPSTGVLQQLTFRADGASSYSRGNGTSGSTTNIGSTGLDLVMIGVTGAGANPLTGDIAEVLVYPSALSDSDRNAVEAYLKAKWGTP